MLCKIVAQEQFLDRYKDRHDTVLTIVANWISNSIKPNCTMHADLPDNRFKPVSDLFQTLRPDVAILTSSTIETLELTICHETNTIKCASESLPSEINCTLI